MKNQSNLLHYDEVLQAYNRIHDALIFTPCVESYALSELTGAEVFCKQEFLQRTGSFKERGARNALLQLSEEQARHGVVAASAGNHALGLAWHGKSLGISVTVVMPKFAPLTKVSRCRKLGAQVVLYGDTFDEARDEANRLASDEKLTYIHPFDNLDVIAGQGTVAIEALQQIPSPDFILIPVGGGGLLSGMATVLNTLSPQTKIIGVEPVNAASFARGLALGKPLTIPTRYTLADGLAVAETGEKTLAIGGALVDQVIQVRERALALAILRLAELERFIVEGAGAAPLAALFDEKLQEEIKGKRVLLILSGGNIDPLAHSRVIERGLAADGRLYRFNVLLSDRPGALVHLSTILAKAGANVTEIVHNRTFSGPDLSRVHVLCTIETRDKEHVEAVKKALAENGVELVANSD